MEHLKTGGLFYAFWRGIKYLIYLIRKPLYKKEQKGLSEQALDRGRLDGYFIHEGDLKLIFSACGISIFWKERELTVSPGLNMAVSTLGLWTNSSKGKWEILFLGRDFFKIKTTYNELPLTQFWYIRIDSQNQIAWRTNILVEEWMHIDEFRFLAMVHPYYKVWLTDYYHDDFPSLDDYWHDICLTDQQVSLVGARFSRIDNPLPSFSIESQAGNLLPLVQNPPLSNHAHIIGIRVNDLKNKNNFEPGIYPILSGRINIIEDERFLDEKIESKRQDYLKNFTKKDKLNQGIEA